MIEKNTEEYEVFWEAGKAVLAAVVHDRDHAASKTLRDAALHFIMMVTKELAPELDPGSIEIFKPPA